LVDELAWVIRAIVVLKFGRISQTHTGVLLRRFLVGTTLLSTWAPDVMVPAGASLIRQDTSSSASEEVRLCAASFQAAGTDWITGPWLWASAWFIRSGGASIQAFVRGGAHRDVIS
jgi:hypothetical protein